MSFLNSELSFAAAQELLGDPNNFEASLRILRERRAYIAEYGFVLLTKESVQLLATQLRGSRVLDAGSGTGYLSHLLAQQGVDITACDMGHDTFSKYGMKKIWRRDHTGDAGALLPGDFDTVLLCWPPYQEDFAARVLAAMRPGQRLIYEGEGRGGCTADDAFFNELQSHHWRAERETTQLLNLYHVSFPGIYDSWSCWTKLS